MLVLCVDYARVSGAGAIYGAGRARPLRGRAEVSLGSRLLPRGRAVRSGGERCRWTHIRGTGRSGKMGIQRRRTVC